MAFLKQTLVLTRKNVLIVLGRHWLTTAIRAFIGPVIFMFFISYAKNFFVPPSDFGVGTPTPVRSLTDALAAQVGGRNTVVFVKNGYTGDVETVVNEISQMVTSAGKTAIQVDTNEELLQSCPSSLRGATNCFAAATFHSSPTQGSGGMWNYTVHGDGALGTKIYVNQQDNDAEIYVLPLQRTIDMAIAQLNGSSLPETLEYPFTSESNQERNQEITRLYQGTLIHILSLAYFIGIVGVCYQLTGQMATERELGMSQLIEASMPNKRRWEPQAARLLSNHLAFDIIYLPGWVIMGIIMAVLVFPSANIGMPLGLTVLGGLSLTSYSILFGAFFNKAQLSGITAVIVSLVLAIIAQLGVGPDASTGAVAILSLLFPPMTFTFFMILTASFQRENLAASLTEFPPNRPWHITGIAFYVFFVIHIIVFPIFGALVERSLYGTASADRKVIHSNSALPVSVRLTKFTKHFSPGWFTRNVLRCGGKRSNNVVVKAVDDVSWELRQGQIMCLLGANGSGKTTTMDAICGLSKITSGAIEVDGYGGLGLCPQKNVLWDELTVYEHVEIFNQLKTADRKATKFENEELISACDLDIKLHARSETLSGGQKRKLQLAMMFTGGSRVCLVDEVSSGIDPLARRKVWDILLRERGRRSILLTTHFLDESDVLSDHIAVMSKGTLRAEGSAVELKHKFGSGYHVYIEDSTRWTPDSSFDKVARYHDYDQMVYQFPDSAETAGFITRLDEANVVYKVQGPTVEDVFLKLSEEIKEDFGTGGTSTPIYDGSSEETSKIGASAVVASPLDREKALNLLPGHGTGLLQQAFILFRKRLVVLRHNYLPYIALVLIPIAAAGLVTLFLKGQPQLSCDPTSQNSIPDLSAFATLISPDVVVGPSSLIPRAALEAAYPGLNDTSLHIVDTVAEFNDYITQNYRNVTPGGFFIDTAGGDSVFAYEGAYDVTFSVLIQNILDNVLAQTQIQTGYQSFASPFAPSAGNTLQVILYFGLAFSAATGFFALYPTAERVRKVRALHYSNGVRSGPLWVAYVAFDFMFVLLISTVAIALWVGQWYGFYYPGYLFVVFFLFGLTSCAYAYVISLFTTSQLAAFAFTAGSQAAMFLLYFIAYLSIITYAPVSYINRWVNYAHFTIAIITPAGNLLRALLLTLNEFSLLCNDRGGVFSYGGNILAFGGPILYLIVQFFLLMAFLIWWDSGGRVALWKRTSHKVQDDEIKEVQDHEVFDELSRIQSSTDGLRVLHLNKAFGTNLAVDDVTFGIGKGETFALLGPNGAGKSTTISLIRGDIRPSVNESKVLVGPYSIAKNRIAARNQLGVVPQTDSMDVMTTVDHLRFYARVRGVKDVNHNVREVMRAVGLNMYANRMALKLSGGNKRKLSLAIALMGNPAVLLLDEPSSGMDAAAKRVMWRVLGSITEGRSLLITTHSMEEADALSQRAGIMAKRMLALGKTEDLRRKHGDAYYVHMVHRDAPHTSAEEMERVKNWVRQNVSGADLEERTYHGQLRFSVPNSQPADKGEKASNGKGRESIDIVPMASGISTLFRLMESNRDELKFAYYAVEPTTLDKVFLNVVRKYNVAEENYAHEHKDDRMSLGARVARRLRKLIKDA